MAIDVLFCSIQRYGAVIASSEVNFINEGLVMNNISANDYHRLQWQQAQLSFHKTDGPEVFKLNNDDAVKSPNAIENIRGGDRISNIKPEDIEALYADGTLSYASGYMHAYNNKSIVGRESRSYVESYKGDGSKTLCFATLDLMTPQIMASSRVTFTHGEDASYDGVTFTSYSPVFTRADSSVSDYDRRHAVTADSCTTCHNDETNYHKNGGYSEGGYDCVACHNNGQDRMSSRHISLEGSEFATEKDRIDAGYIVDAAYGGDGWQAKSAPGFGPMIHAMHWGAEQTIVGSDADGVMTNSSAELNAANCVSCHAEGIDLYAIPNQYMRAKSLNLVENENGGLSPDTTKMASPITANCYACHDSESALNHMEQNGGEIDAEVVTDWYLQSTMESCSTCHAEGKSFGIDKFHVFER